MYFFSSWMVQDHMIASEQLNAVDLVLKKCDFCENLQATARFSQSLIKWFITSSSPAHLHIRYSISEEEDHLLLHLYLIVSPHRWYSRFVISAVQGNLLSSHDNYWKKKEPDNTIFIGKMCGHAQNLKSYGWHMMISARSAVCFIEAYF